MSLSYGPAGELQVPCCPSWISLLAGTQSSHWSRKDRKNSVLTIGWRMIMRSKDSYMTILETSGGIGRVKSCHHCALSALGRPLCGAYATTIRAERSGLVILTISVRWSEQTTLKSFSRKKRWWRLSLVNGRSKFTQSSTPPCLSQCPEERRNTLSTLELQASARDSWMPAKCSPCALNCPRK